MQKIVERLNFYDIPFFHRVILLVFIMVVIAIVDFLRHREKSLKWREYLFALGCGGLGAIFGISVDLITSRISPEYFVHGKGISSDDDFLRNVVILGSQAGFVAGILAGCVLLFLNNPKPSCASLPFSFLWRQIARPMGVALIFGTLFPVLFGGWDPLKINRDFNDVLTEQQRHWFLFVWKLHLGLYSGLLCGILWSGFEIWRRRKYSSESATTNQKTDGQPT